MNLELTIYDQLVRLRADSYKSDSQVVLIGITEGDIERLGTWPLSDAMLSKVINLISLHNPSAIGLDIYRDIPVPPGKAELTEALRKHSNVVTVRKIASKDEKGVARVYALDSDDLVGSNDVLIDPDGIVRRGLLFISEGDETVPTFSLLLTLIHLQGIGITPEADSEDPSLMKLGKAVFIPLAQNDGGYINIDSRGYQYLIDFRQARFREFNLHDLLNNSLTKKDLEGKIVIVGSKAESLKDQFFTPLGSSIVYSNSISGIALHGLMTDHLIRASTSGVVNSRPISEHTEIAAIVLWALIGALVGATAASIRWFFIIMTANLTVLVFSVWLLFMKGWWVPLLPQTLSTIVSAGIISAFVFQQERRDRAVLMRLFSSHVSKDIAENIWLNRKQFMDKGRLLSTKMDITVLFSDLVGFTCLSEKMEPRELMDWLNQYMSEMTMIVIDHKGVVNKYIGDAVMAVFGIPVMRNSESEKAEDAINAVDCAVSMGKKLEELNKLWRQQGLHQVGMRIGIASGDAVAGALGSKERMEYTVIGDLVNTASRLEGCLKEEFEREPRCWRVIINKRTYEHVKDSFIIKPLGSIALKGKEMNEEIYQVLDSVAGHQ